MKSSLTLNSATLIGNWFLKGVHGSRWFPLVWGTISTLWHFYRYLKKRNSVLVSVFLSPSELLYKYVYHSFADGGLNPERSPSQPIWCGSTAQCSHVKLPFHPLSIGFPEIWGRHIYSSVLLFSLWYIFMDFIHSLCLGYSRYGS